MIKRDMILCEVARAANDTCTFAYGLRAEQVPLTRTFILARCPASPVPLASA